MNLEEQKIYEWGNKMSQQINSQWEKLDQSLNLSIDYVFNKFPKLIRIQEEAEESINIKYDYYPSFSLPDLEIEQLGYQILIEIEKPIKQRLKDVYEEYCSLEMQLLKQNELQIYQNQFLEGLIKNFANDNQDLNSEISELESKISELESKIRELKSEIRKQNQKVEDLTFQLEDLQSDYDEKVKEISRLKIVQSDYDEKVKEISRLKMVQLEVEDLQFQYDLKEKEISRLKIIQNQRIIDLEQNWNSKLDQENNRYKQLQIEKQNIKEQLLEKDETIQDKNSEIKRLIHQVDKQHQYFMDARDEIAKLQKIVKGKYDKLGEYEIQIKNITRELRESQQKNKDLQDQLQSEKSKVILLQENEKNLMTLFESSVKNQKN